MTVHVHSVPSPADALHLVTEDLEHVCRQSPKTLTLGSVVAALMDGSAQLWLVLEDESYAGCYVTEIVEQGGFVHIVAARIRPGSEAFEPSIAQLSEWAHGFGARLSGTSRRPGLGRLLARLGWEPRFVEYVEPEAVLGREAAA